MNPPTTRRTPVEHINPLRIVCERDDVVVEEPLEIRFGGTTVGITMRTPGSDSELALGFLLSEGILEPSEEVDRVDITETEAASGLSMSFREGRGPSRGTGLELAAAARCKRFHGMVNPPRRRR